jgi:Zn-dependent peptidase ImmA (M78 family)
MADGISFDRRESRFSLIEESARTLQLQLWKDRKDIWRDSVPSEPLGVLQPGVALRIKGYTIASSSSIEETSLHGDPVQIAGEIDPGRKIVRLSSRFPKEEQAFTAAHELGHVMLGHDILNGDGTIHRDRPFSGVIQQYRSQQEREADWFAAWFLMPRKIVMAEFRQSFCVDRFVLTDETAFALCAKSIDAVLLRCRSRRDLSFMLASAMTYGGRAIAPLYKRFGVSRSAMAIQLNELDLISGDGLGFDLR